MGTRVVGRRKFDSSFPIFPGCTFEPRKKKNHGGGGVCWQCHPRGERRAGAGGAPRGSNRWFCILSGRVRCGERCGLPGSRSSAVPATQWRERMAGHTLSARGWETPKPLQAALVARLDRAVADSCLPSCARASCAPWLSEGPRVARILAPPIGEQTGRWRGGSGGARVIIMQGAGS